MLGHPAKVFDAFSSHATLTQTLCSIAKGTSFRIGLVSHLALSIQASNHLYSSIIVPLIANGH